MPSPVEHTSDHLRVFFVIHAVFFTLGLTRMVDATYAQPTLRSVVVMIALAFIGLRLIFSWSP